MLRPQLAVGVCPRPWPTQAWLDAGARRTALRQASEHQPNAILGFRSRFLGGYPTEFHTSSERHAPGWRVEYAASR